MILMFHETEHYGKYFWTAENEFPDDTTGFVPEIPPDTAHVWEPSLGKWALPAVGPREEEEGEEE